MIVPLKRSVDFERVLRTRSRVSSAHFALHHLGSTPPAIAELSTAPGSDAAAVVDDSPRPAPERVCLGTVVPKRHARRAVTRNLLKRQIRSVAAEHADVLAAGFWVVRLRAPFDRATYPSPGSDALRRTARAELQQLLDRAATALR